MKYYRLILHDPLRSKIEAPNKIFVCISSFLFFELFVWIALSPINMPKSFLHENHSRYPLFNNMLTKNVAPPSEFGYSTSNPETWP